MKKTKKIFTLFFALMILTGCVKYNITIDFSDGESAILESQLFIKESDLNTNQISIDDIKQQLLSNNDIFDKWSIKDISKTIDNEKYKGLMIQAPDTINEELAKNLTMSEDKKIATYILKINFQESGIDLSELTNYQSTITTLKNNQSTFELVIKMPGQITQSSIGEIHNNTVTIDLYEYLLSGHIPNITITSQEESIDDSFYLYLFMGFIIIIAIGLVYYLTMKKRKKDI